MRKIEPNDNELVIIIPTYKRETVKQQIAYSMIPEEFKPYTYFLIREERHELMLKAFPDAKYILIPKDSVVCLSDTRQWVLENTGYAKQWHMDDDVKLFGKRDSNYRIRGKINLEEFTELYNLISTKLDEYAYVGLAARLFNNLNTDQFSENKAIYTCFALRADVILAEGGDYAGLMKINPEITIAEDKWMCAYLLGRGLKNLVLNEWVYDQKDGHVGSAAVDLGGCYGHKTKNSNDLASEEFIKAYPGCVYKKTQKVKVDGVVVDEYQYPIVRWQKVYDIAIAKLKQP